MKEFPMKSTSCKSIHRIKYDFVSGAWPCRSGFDDLPGFGGSHGSLSPRPKRHAAYLFSRDAQGTLDARRSMKTYAPEGLTGANLRGLLTDCGAGAPAGQIADIGAANDPLLTLAGSHYQTLMNCRMVPTGVAALQFRPVASPAGVGSVAVSVAVAPVPVKTTL